jgi:hypothetical protein
VGCQVREDEPAQQLLPKLLGENAGTQQMVDRLLLVAKRAAVRVREAAPREPVRSPAAIMCNQPEKEFVLNY